MSYALPHRCYLRELTPGSKGQKVLIIYCVTPFSVCVCPLHSVLSEAVEMTLSSPDVKTYSQSRLFTYQHTIFAKFWLLSSTEIMLSMASFNKCLLPCANKGKEQ